jgi:hypothetical protein
VALVASRLTATIDASAAGGPVIPFNSGLDDYGVDWRMATLDGWDSPDLPEAAAERPQQDGLWDALNYYGGRTLTLTGVCTAATYEDREAAEYRLRKAIPRNRTVMVTVAETTPKWVSARRSGRLMVRPLTETISEYNISMLAPDPRKYGTNPISGTVSVSSGSGGLAPPWTPPVTLTASGTGASQALFTNDGDYQTPPLITIRGPGYGIGLYNLTNGNYLMYNLTLGVSDYIAVDVAAGVSLLNGTGVRAPAPGSTITGNFFLDPGPNLLQITGTLTDVTVPSAYIAAYPAWT